MASSSASAFCAPRPVSPVRLRPGLTSTPARTASVQRQVRPGPRRTSPGRSPSPQTTPVRSHDRNIRLSGISAEEVASFKHEMPQAVEAPLRQRRPPTRTAPVNVTQAGAVGVIGTTSITARGGVAVSTNKRIDRSNSVDRKAGLHMAPSHVVRSSSVESLSRKPQRSLSGNVTTLSGNVRDTSVRLRAPPSAARVHPGVVQPPPFGGTIEMPMPGARTPLNRKTDRARSGSANRSFNSFESPKRSTPRRVSSQTPPPRRGAKYVNLSKAPGNDAASVQLASRVTKTAAGTSNTQKGSQSSSTKNKNELLNSISTTTQDDSIPLSADTSCSSINASFGFQELDCSVPTLPPTARPLGCTQSLSPLGPPQSLASPPGRYAALGEESKRNKTNARKEIVGNQLQRPRTESESSATTSASPGRRHRDFPFAVTADLELGGPALRADAAKQGSCSSISSPRTVCHTTRGVEDYVVETVALRADAAKQGSCSSISSPRTVCHTTRGVEDYVVETVADDKPDVLQSMLCDDSTLLRKEPQKGGCATIIVDDVEGTRVGTFGEECINFELRCKDTRKVDAWLDNIETRLLPGLLSLLEDEVKRQSDALGRQDGKFAQKRASRIAIWNPRMRASMLKAHSDLRDKLLQVTESRMSNALAG